MLRQTVIARFTTFIALLFKKYNNEFELVNIKRSYMFGYIYKWQYDLVIKIKGLHECIQCGDLMMESGLCEDCMVQETIFAIEEGIIDV